MNAKRKVSYFLITALLFMLFFIMRVQISFGKENLTVSFLKVGNARAVLVRSPTGANILIDGGRDSATLRALSSVLNPLDRNISVVIETNPSAGNTGGLAKVLSRYHVGAFLTSGAPNQTTSSRLTAEFAGRVPHLLHLRAVRGMRFDIGKGAYIKVLSPEHGTSKTNAQNNSVVLRVVYGKTSFLLPSDVSRKIELRLVAFNSGEQLSSDVLSIGHFGARNSIDLKWLLAVHPRYAVISVGENKYGYPAPSTLKMLTSQNISVCTTRTHSIAFVSDGYSVWVKK